MNLVIHDLGQEGWEKRAAGYDGWKVISDNGLIRPCVGCFGCWNRDPGRCVIKDGYENMGELIHHAEEVHIISRFTYGGFSGFVKNVIDRCLGYVLPHFEIVKGESHHKKRYDEDKPFTFIFYGNGISDEEKAAAERYVKALCTNFRSHVKEVIFEEDDRTVTPVERENRVPDGGTVLLNASMRSKNGNSALLAAKLRKRLKRDARIMELSGYTGDMEKIVEDLKDASTIVLCTPLYVDGLPSQLIRMMECFTEKYRGPSKNIYVLANMGLYENKQLVNLFYVVRNWCDKTGLHYGGALGVAAGELVGGLDKIVGSDRWPLKKIGEDMKLFGKAIDDGNDLEEIYSGPSGFPRWLYVAIANSGWKRMAKRNGISKKDLFRRL